MIRELFYGILAWSCLAVGSIYMYLGLYPPAIFWFAVSAAFFVAEIVCGPDRRV